MIRKSFALALIGGVVLALSATTSHAGWWHGGSHGSSGGSSGSYGSSGGSSGSWGGSSGYSHSYGSSGGWASSGGSSGSWGGHRHGLFGHKHRAWGGSSGSYGGSSGYSSSYGGSSGGYGYSSYGYGSTGGSSGGSYGGAYSSGYGSSYGSQGGVISGGVISGGEVYSTPGSSIYSTPGVQGTPSMPAPPPVPANPMGAPAPAAAPPAGASYSPIENGTAAIISVNVPTSAKVFVNGNATTSTGNARQYISRGLKAGQLYTYEFRLEAEVNGKLVTETKQIQVTGGQRAELAFNTPADAPVVGKVAKPDANKTTLILNVPADARVTLGGAATQQTGAVREFSTEKLAAGDKWENYTIRVEATIDGQVRVAEKTVTVNAGDYRELSFDLTATEVTRTASR